MPNVGTCIPVEVMLPAPTQAVIGIECRADDSTIQSILTIIDDATTQAAVHAERAFVGALGGSCTSPVAALATVDHGRIRMQAQLLSEDGRDQLRDEAEFECADSDTPRQLARRMLERAPDSIRTLFAGR